MKLTTKTLLHPIVILGSLLTLNACIYNDVIGVQKVRDTTISQGQNPAFEKALAAEYKTLALYEADKMHDWADAGKFAEKSLIAHGGAKPLPEQTKDWNLKFGAKRLDAARARLTALMARDAPNKAPILAAKAQANFDCWVEQMEEGWQFDHIELCQNNYQKSVIKLERQLATPNSVKFAINESRLDAAATAEFLTVAVEAKRLDAPLASIVGFADSSGSKAYNMKLSLERADEIASILTAAGYPKDRIAVSAYGEDRLLIPTRDGISNPDNRRVEVIFYPNIDF